MPSCVSIIEESAFEKCKNIKCITFSENSKLKLYQY